MRWLASAVVLLPLAAGGPIPCPEPNYPNIRNCPFPVDPNVVQGRLLGWVCLEIGESLRYTRTWCDAEGDPAEAEILAGPDGVQIVNKPKTSSYTLLWTARQAMTTAIVIRVTDQPARGEPKSSVGTILVQVVPRGRHVAPKGCGSPPR